MTKEQYNQAKRQLALRYKDEKSELALSYKAEKTDLALRYKQDKAQLYHSYKQAKNQLALSYKQAKDTLKKDYEAQKKLIPPKPKPIQITGGSIDPIYRPSPIYGLPWGAHLVFFSDRPAWGYFQYHLAAPYPSGKPKPWVRYSMERHNGTTYEWELQNKSQAKNAFESNHAWKGDYVFRGAAWDPQTKKYTYGSFTLSFSFK